MSLAGAFVRAAAAEAAAVQRWPDLVALSIAMAAVDALLLPATRALPAG
ncbi:hypothetical protein ACRBEV_16675 [Methylobacterium phyllosphaerae]